MNNNPSGQEEFDSALASAVAEYNDVDKYRCDSSPTTGAPSTSLSTDVGEWFGIIDPTKQRIGRFILPTTAVSTWPSYSRIFSDMLVIGVIYRDKIQFRTGVIDTLGQQDSFMEYTAYSKHFDVAQDVNSPPYYTYKASLGADSIYSVPSWTKVSQ